MLVLDRKLHEAIIIDENTTIRIERITGKSVRLSFEGPARVVREEIILRGMRSPLGPKTGNEKQT